MANCEAPAPDYVRPPTSTGSESSMEAQTLARSGELFRSDLLSEKMVILQVGLKAYCRNQ